MIVIAKYSPRLDHSLSSKVMKCARRFRGIGPDMWLKEVEREKYSQKRARGIRLIAQRSMREALIESVSTSVGHKNGEHELIGGRR